MIKNLFLIITADKYPNGDAGAIREHAFAKILDTLGYTPIVIGIGESTYFNEKKYDGIRYYSVRYSNNNIIYRIMGRLFFLHNVKKVIKKIHLEGLKGILVVSGGQETFDYAEMLSKIYKIPLYHDSVEWFSPGEFSRGEKDSSYKANNNLNTKIIDKKYKVFVISRYLEHAFQKRDIQTLRIPVVMDVKKIKCEKNVQHGDIIKIVYAGQVGGKDRLSEIVRAMESLDAGELSKLQFTLIGITKEQYENKFGKVRKDLIDKNIFFMGRISRENVLKELKSAHFTVLIRPENERYAKAGFPTKVVESLSTATPVICNYTSDLELYLKDGYNAVVIENCSIEACKKGLKRLLCMSEKELIDMQHNARSSAEKNFDWRLYINCVKKFIN